MNIINFPVLVFALSLLMLWLAAQAGAYLRRGRRNWHEAEREDLGVILVATLTLLGLIIGFSFSMAVNRYDQRKAYEEQETNAIGTAYVRATLLPPADATRLREWLRSYLHQRILFYTAQNGHQHEQINTATAQLQTNLWSTVQIAAGAQPTPIIALAVSGMNDVLNSQGHTQAAWWNRIPMAAWTLMVMIAICCNVLVGFNVRHVEEPTRWFFILPLIVSIAFFLIAEMDSPRGGIIRVHPHNLESLSRSLGAP